MPPPAVYAPLRAQPNGLDWTDEQRTSLFLMSANDITPIRSSTDEPFSLILVACNLVLTVW